MDLNLLLNRQRKAFEQDPYPSLKTRQDRLDRVADMLIRHESAICDAVMADFSRRSAITTQAAEILPILEACKHAKKNLAYWMLPQPRKSNFPLGLLGAKSQLRYLPLGVVGNISPWNFPIQLSLAPLAGIFSAGNRSILKPSELTAQTSELLAQIVAENFNDDELAVVLGEASVAANFSALQFDHLLFTGSTEIGRKVAVSAAQNLVPVTLELGGKNPVLVSKTADISLAAKKIMWGKTLNGGQICLSPDMVFVPETQLDEFIRCCEQSVNTMYSDINNDSDYTHIIREDHAQRLRKMTEQVKAQGAQVIELGEFTQQCVPPILVINPDDNSQLMQQETFGSILSIISYRDIQSAYDYIREQPKPLALYYFGNSQDEIDFVTTRIRSGGLTINDCFGHQMQDDLPFGGVGDSGIGHYHGFAGFQNFSHARGEFYQSKFDPFRFIRPPYSERMLRLFHHYLKSHK